MNNAERVFLQVEEEILKNMVRLLAEDQQLDPESWQLAKLNQLGGLKQKTVKQLAEQAEIEFYAMQEMLEKAGYEAVDIFERDLRRGADQAILLNPPNVEDSQVLKQVLKAHNEEAKRVINNVNNTLLKQMDREYVHAVSDITGLVVAGVKTQQQALGQVINKWAEKGIPAMVDKLGRKWSTEAYVAMMVRSSANNVAHDMQDARMEEYGNDLIEISSHMGARPRCAPFQGKIFSLSGTSDIYDSIADTSYGEAAGLFGINCGHFKYPYIPGITKQTYFPYDKEENDKAYAESQKQRYHERRIRAAKKEIGLMEAAGDLEGVQAAKAKVRKRQASMRDFIDESGRTRRYDREKVFDETKKAPSRIRLGSHKGLEKAMGEEDYRAFRELVNRNDSMANLYGSTIDRIGEIKYGKGAHHSAEDNSITAYFDTEQPALNKYHTFAHELGHFFDTRAIYKNATYAEVETLMGYGDYAEVYTAKKGSTSDQFLKAIRKDKAALEDIYMMIVPDLRGYVTTLGVQDAFDGMFGTQQARILSWGHGERYYNRKYNDAKYFKDHNNVKEAFLALGYDSSNAAKTKALLRDHETANEVWANLAAGHTVGGNELASMVEYLPNSNKAFLELIKEVE